MTVDQPDDPRTKGSLLSFLMRYALLLVGLYYIGLYLYIALSRIGYPFELEWMEGGSVDHVRRILAGKPIYVAPSLEFVPYIYTPLYFYLSALVAKVMGVGFLALRLVSFVSSLGCLFVIALIVYREARDGYAAALAACLFAATFRIGGAWLDLARVDSLGLLWLLIVLYAVRFIPGVKGAIAAGILFWFAYLTKQTALVLWLPLLIYYFMGNRRHAVTFAITTGVTIGLTTLILDLVHDGWYRYYLFYLPSRHPFKPFSVKDYWYGDFARHLPIALALAALFFGSVSKKEHRRTLLFYGLVAAGIFLSSWLARLHKGGYNNVLLPSYAMTAILFGLGFHPALRWIKQRWGERKYLVEMCFYSACLLQFSMLRYDLTRQIPTAEDERAGDRIVEIIKSYEGDVLVTYHGYLAAMAGKSGYAPGLAFHVFLVEGDPVTLRFEEEIEEAIASKRFDAILHQKDWIRGQWFENILKTDYRLTRSLPQGTEFVTVAGVPTRPRDVHEPKPDR